MEYILLSLLFIMQVVKAYWINLYLNEKVRF